MVLNHDAKGMQEIVKFLSPTEIARQMNDLQAYDIETW